MGQRHRGRRGRQQKQGAAQDGPGPDQRGARTVRISDGAITGPAFFDHVRRCTRPVVNSPKGQTSLLPPDLVRREIVAPKVYWTWSLVWRENEERAGVLAVVDVMCDGVGDLGLREGDVWLPSGDPHALPR
ncbi:hypothetical protein C7821_10733 [Streptomyces sp. VMFN-G11Ma]|nr:hypothetical protein C7821_10733 [Streptomyces sp. VMFN-G11Ma]